MKRQIIYVLPNNNDIMAMAMIVSTDFRSSTNLFYLIFFFSLFTGYSSNHWFSPYLRRTGHPYAGVW